MYWRVGSAYQKNPRDKNKAAFKRVVQKGPPPGLMAFDGDVAVGWCQLTPRAALPVLDRSRFTARVDQLPVWSLSCFYIRKGRRGHGIMSALIDASIMRARASGAPALEAYPMDAKGVKKSNTTMYTGSASTFRKAGFRKVAGHAPHRPIMRLNLKKAAT
ncbi:MAG: GNAT family N-acetyltransferase [Proteobacteria bacterium]|nr:GNAT family N-acetyltransferase [Pseudomonadota bacterium]